MNETYHGHVRTPADAIKLFEACRRGLLPRVQRRLSEKERQSIRPGSVFVWDEREAGMRRWTDGKSWSASRVSGSFLTYREMEGKRTGGMGTTKRTNRRSPESGRSEDDHDDGEPEGYRYKADGLLKQSFSITTSSNQHLHLISYYCRPPPGEPEMKQPTKDPALRQVHVPAGLYPESSTGEANPTPAMTTAPMQQPHPMLMQGHSYAHAPAYSQPGYGLPPSPMSTPPYAPYSGHVPPQQSHYTHTGPSHYEQQRLPPLPTHQHAHETPREYQQLQAAASAVVNTSYKDYMAQNSGSSQGSLPPLLNLSGGPPQAITTPPSRGLSTSPLRDAKKEPISPRQSVLPPLPDQRKDRDLDNVALRALDKKFWS